jgi:hypothetical protein
MLAVIVVICRSGSEAPRHALESPVIALICRKRVGSSILSPPTIHRLGAKCMRVDVEQQVTQILRRRLHGLATVQSVKLDGDRISVEVVSPDHFQGTAAFLEQAAGEIAQATHCSIDVTLLAHWPKR